MKYQRTLRISEEIKKIVSHLIRFDIKDPRVSELTSVTKVETTNDLRFCTIYITVHDDDTMDETLAGLERAKGFVRREIGKGIDLRYTPEPIFKADASIAESIRMSKLIEQVKRTHNHDEDA